MTGTKWLSEAVHPEEFQNGCLNVVTAPVGCGKSTWALNDLPKLVSKPYKMLHLIDTRNGNKQIVLQNDITEFYSDEWRETVENNLVWFGEANYNEKIVVMTYAKFGKLAEKYPSFGSDFELILCDEIHNLPRFSCFGEREINCHRSAMERLEKLIELTNVLMIGITATPQRVYNWLGNRCHTISIDEGVRQYEIRQTILYRNQFEALKQLSPKEKGIVYFMQVGTMQEFQQAAGERGFRTVCIWGDHYAIKMTEEQIAAKNHILEKEELPPQYDMIIINASCETGINIRGKMDYVMVHNKNKDTRTQVRGRYRGDLDRLYLLDDKSEIIVPEEYLDRRLFAKDKEELCKVLNIRNNSGHLMKWATVKRKLIQNGYYVNDKGREKNRRYAIISV